MPMQRVEFDPEMWDSMVPDLSNGEGEGMIPWSAVLERCKMKPEDWRAVAKEVGDEALDPCSLGVPLHPLRLPRGARMLSGRWKSAVPASQLSLPASVPAIVRDGWVGGPDCGRAGGSRKELTH